MMTKTSGRNGSSKSGARRKLALACTAAALSLLSTTGTARADFPAPAVYIGLYGGGNLVLRDWDLGDTARTSGFPTHGGLGGLRIGAHVLSRLAIEAEVAYLPLSATGGGDLNHALAYDVELVFHILKGNWTPTVEAGFGGYTNLAGNLGSDTDPRGHVGIGLRGLLTKQIAFRVDLRDVISDHPHDDLGSNNLELTIGFDFFLWTGEKDRDKDGVPDSKDACPDEKGPASQRGCPDTDKDGVIDAEDRCPEVPGTKAFQGCADLDGDRVPDPDDRCMEVPAGKFADKKRPGCPADRDGDGVIDERDQCVDVPKSTRPDAKRPGCPADRDGDGVIDESDACINVAGAPNDDPAKHGCPADRDGDTVPDDSDACPDKFGAPSPDPKKNGCPGLVKIERGQIVILQKVYFETGKDAIMSKSFPVLNAVADAIKTMPVETRIAVEGHTDNKGKPEKNLDLSQRRAISVVAYLAGAGIGTERLEAKGYGQDRPIADNKTAKGREENRRVEFHILIDAAPASEGTSAPAPAPTPEAAPPL
mgnify:CR=1 FL=1